MTQQEFLRSETEKESSPQARKALAKVDMALIVDRKIAAGEIRARDRDACCAGARKADTQAR